MAKVPFKDVDDYICVQPAATQAVLQRVRRTLRKALPGSQEVISYGIPAYKLDGKNVVYFAGWKEHTPYTPQVSAWSHSSRKNSRNIRSAKEPSGFHFPSRYLWS